MENLDLYGDLSGPMVAGGGSNPVDCGTSDHGVVMNMGR